MELPCQEGRGAGAGDIFAKELQGKIVVKTWSLGCLGLMGL